MEPFRSVEGADDEVVSAPRPGGRVPWALVALVATGIAFAGWLWVSRPEPETSPAADAAPPGAPVVASVVQQASMTVYRRYPGEVFADAVDVSSRISGHVQVIDVRIGDAVQAGQVIARIDDTLIKRQIRETKAQIRAQRSTRRAAAVAQDAANRRLERAKPLSERGVVSTQELDDLETTLRQREADVSTSQARLEEAEARLAVLQEDLRDTAITTPFAGVIARRDVDPGAFVQPGTPLVRLVAAEPLRVRFRVPEYELHGIHEGLVFTLQTRAETTGTPQGHVTRLSGEVSRADRTLQIEGVLDEPHGLRPGMYVDVVLEVRTLDDAAIVPDACVLERVDAAGHGSVGVFVVDGETARWTAVRVLGRHEGRAAIEALDGRPLPAGTQVLSRGHRELADGARIRLVDAGSLAPQGQP